MGLTVITPSSPAPGSGVGVGCISAEEKQEKRTRSAGIIRRDCFVFIDDNLTGLFYEPIVKAKNGGHGMGKKMHGRSAPAKIVKVPVGTLVRRTEEGKRPTFNAQRPTPNAEAHDAGSDQFAIANPQSEIDLVVDLTRDGQEFVLCRGGAGGKGNVHFKSSRNRAPREYTEGEEGEQGPFLLELRTIADAGLVGYPNAGKST